MVWFPESTPTAPGGAPLLDQLKPHTIASKLERDGQIIDTGSVVIRYDNDNVQYTRIEGPIIYGYFAATKGAKSLPVVVFLFGGGVGLVEGAKWDTGLFAAHGYVFLSSVWPKHGNGSSRARKLTFRGLVFEGYLKALSLRYLPQLNIRGLAQ